MILRAPEPKYVSRARQFFTPNGTEIFFAEVHGRRQADGEVTDSLRVMGWGPDRESARREAVKNWKRAWKKLHTKEK